MKTKTGLILGGVALVAMAVPAAVGWSAQQNVTLNATAAPFCSFVANPTITPSNMSVVSASASATTLSITAPVNSTGHLNAASFLFSISSKCNTSSRVVLTTANGGLKDSTPGAIAASSAASFRNVINYTASAVWQATSVAGLVTDGTPGISSSGNTIVGAKSGALLLSFILDNSATEVVVAGDYSDVLTLTLEPQ